MNFFIKNIVLCATALIAPSVVAALFAAAACSSVVMMWTAGVVAFVGTIAFIAVVAGGPLLFLLCLALMVLCFEQLVSKYFQQERERASKINRRAMLRLNVSFARSRSTAK